MPKTIPVASVKWFFECAPGSEIATLKCRDDVTQRDYSFDLPLHTLPTLVDGLRQVIEAHPDDFPETLATRFT